MRLVSIPLMKLLMLSPHKPRYNPYYTPYGITCYYNVSYHIIFFFKYYIILYYTSLQSLIPLAKLLLTRLWQCLGMLPHPTCSWCLCFQRAGKSLQVSTKTWCLTMFYPITGWPTEAPSSPVSTSASWASLATRRLHRMNPGISSKVGMNHLGFKMI